MATKIKSLWYQFTVGKYVATMQEKVFLGSDDGLWCQKNRQIQWNKGFLIWTMAFWEKRDFFMIKNFCIPSSFCTLLERTQNTFTELTEKNRNCWFDANFFAPSCCEWAFEGWDEFCAGRRHAAVRHKNRRCTWRKVPRFEFKSCDDVYFCQPVCAVSVDISSLSITLNDFKKLTV